MATALFALLIIILFFLLGRELICWYFKINQRVDLLRDILDKLDLIK